MRPLGGASSDCGLAPIVISHKSHVSQGVLCRIVSSSQNDYRVAFL